MERITFLTSLFLAVALWHMEWSVQRRILCLLRQRRDMLIFFAYCCKTVGSSMDWANLNRHCFLLVEVSTLIFQSFFSTFLKLLIFSRWPCWSCEDFIVSPCQSKWLRCGYAELLILGVLPGYFSLDRLCCFFSLYTHSDFQWSRAVLQVLMKSQWSYFSEGRTLPPRIRRGRIVCMWPVFMDTTALVIDWIEKLEEADIRRNWIG